ncbi:hypothetical protein Tco_0669791 [Tanacetum coccineum]
MGGGVGNRMKGSYERRLDDWRGYGIYMDTLSRMRLSMRLIASQCNSGCWRSLITQVSYFIYNVHTCDLRYAEESAYIDWLFGRMWWWDRFDIVGTEAAGHSVKKWFRKRNDVVIQHTRLCYCVQVVIALYA